MSNTIAPPPSDEQQAEGPITSAVRKLVEDQRLCYVATVGPDGQPNLSPKGSLKVLDAHHLAFADMASPQTVSNLRANPRLEINVVDPFLRSGYRLSGIAEVRDDAELLSVVGAGLGHEFPIRTAVYITVTVVRRVDSPVYLFTDTSPEEVHAMWEQNYGYRSTRPPVNGAAVPVALTPDGTAPWTVQGGAGSV